MPLSVTPTFAPLAMEPLAEAEGRIAVILPPEGKLSGLAQRLNRTTRGAIARVVESEAWHKLKPGQAIDLAYPTGLKAEVLQLVKLARRAATAEARKAGAAIGKVLGEKGAVVLAGSHPKAAEIAFGAMLRAYDFALYRTGEVKVKGPVTLLVGDVEAARAAMADREAVAEGVAFTRDLVSEPSNVLTTVDFARRLFAMRSLGLKVEVLDEEALTKLGMRALLGVGQGSESPSQVVVMEWQGGKKGEAPFAFVGKGVCFDSGGISIKPAAGMEDMTMDMGGAGVVAGLMRTLAMRGAKANVVGLVGLVENMPDGRAQRPGDIVTSMKGDTIEV
ncbi:MAG: leucyl aminopeptidase, partial [Rhodobacteraceae bacterium]|nr:leucyl aminopeptidase [Paracoccaceae bacterium]